MSFFSRHTPEINEQPLHSELAHPQVQCYVIAILILDAFTREYKPISHQLENMIVQNVDPQHIINSSKFRAGVNIQKQGNHQYHFEFTSISHKFNITLSLSGNRIVCTKLFYRYIDKTIFGAYEYVLDYNGDTILQKRNNNSKRSRRLTQNDFLPELLESLTQSVF